MRILLTGANGFLGAHILAGLLRRGHAVVAAVRDPARLRRQVPGAEAIACDFNRDIDPAVWLPRVAGIEAVVNCAGVLQSAPGQSIRAIHVDAPKALFDACRQAGVRKVVQISAVGVDPPADTLYAQTKKAGDDHLKTLDLDWVILRPSLVYASGTWGGTSLMRGLAALPCVLPLVGDGSQPFRPLHVDDLVETVVRVLEQPDHVRQIIEVVGPERLTLRDILLKLRAWLGFAPARALQVPVGLIEPLARIGDLFGGPLSSTSLRQMQAGAAGDWPDGQFERRLGFRPRTMDESLADTPAQIQDRWHARLYFLRPVLRIVLAGYWAAFGADRLLALLQVDRSGPPIPSDLMIRPVAYGAICVMISALILIGWRPRLMAAIQILITFVPLPFILIEFFSWSLLLWTVPSSILAALPLALAIWIWAILEEGR